MMITKLDFEMHEEFKIVLKAQNHNNARAILIHTWRYTTLSFTATFACQCKILLRQ